MTHTTRFFDLAQIGFLVLFSALILALPAKAQDKNVSITLIADKAQVEGGDTITIGIQETIKPKWHVYWVNPGDSGEPTKVSWSGLSGLDVQDIQWPVPHKLPLGPLTNYGYEGEVTLLQDITLPRTLPDGPITLTADITLLVCEEICIPEIHQAQITLNDGGSSHPVEIAEARNALPLPVSWEAEYYTEDGNIHFKINTENTASFEKIDSIELFPYEGGLIANAAKPEAYFVEGGLMIEQPKGELKASDIPETKAVIAYLDKDGNRKAIEVDANYNKAAEAMAIAAASPQDNNKEIGLIGALVSALIGGLILNLMPCVFPVLSLKALSLVNSKNHDEREAKMHGVAYTVGVIASFLVIAGILIALKSGGAQIGWGFQLQNPIVVAVLAYLLFLVGLNLAGFFEVSAGRLANVGSSLANKNGISGSFFTGILATAVATPCTAPFMAAALGYTLTQPAPVALLVFATLGFGLALPFLLLTFIPALRTALPRPGAWMETFKQFLAFPMFGFAAWLISVLSHQADSLSVMLTLLGLVALSFAIWAWQKKARAVAIIGLLLALAPLTTIKATTTPEMVMSTMTEGQNWIAFSDAAFTEALQNPAPVFVNMTAAWCITCKVNERVALSPAATKMLFKERGVQYLKGDWTNRDPEISKFLERYGRNGVPLYVYYGPVNAATAQRPEPVILPQILTPAIVRETIENSLF